MSGGEGKGDKRCTGAFWDGLERRAIIMGFRTLEISNAAEIHIKEGQMEITTEKGVAVIPIEDLNQIIKQKL